MSGRQTFSLFPAFFAKHRVDDRDCRIRIAMEMAQWHNFHQNPSSCGLIGQRAEPRRGRELTSWTSGDEHTGFEPGFEHNSSATAPDLRGTRAMALGHRFRVAPGTKVKLRDIDPDHHGKHADKETANAEIERDIARMAELQALLYAENQRALLICLQGLDASGKDGTIAHVFRGMNPQGVEVTQFKSPTREELAHDFLWRIHRQAPERGRVMIFNRSQYEDVLVVRVHELVPKDVWSSRYDRINEFEKNLIDAGTSILKFYLHISEDEQLRRFERRFDDPVRQWKISESDYEERKFWPQYIEAFEDVFHKTSTSDAPWYISPANHKWFRNYAVAGIVVEAMESLGLKTPRPSVNLEEIRKKYHAAAKEGHKAARHGGAK